MAFGEPVGADQNVLHPFTVPGTALRGVATVLFDMGMTISAEAATRLLAAHEISTLALVGIAGGLDREIRLGDVVVASSVEEYLQAAKATSDPEQPGYDFTPAGTAWKPDSKLISYVRNFRYLQGAPADYPSWQARAIQRQGSLPADPPPGLFCPRPDYFVLPVATGDVVAAAQPFADWLRRHNRRRAAIETEAGGVAQAVYQHGQCDLLVIRGISDFADGRKAQLDAMAAPGAGPGAWRRYAALNAFDLFATLLSHPRFPWREGITPPAPATSGDGGGVSIGRMDSAGPVTVVTGGQFRDVTIGMQAPPERGHRHAEHRPG